MTKTYPFKAIENGTLGNPYRFVQKGDVVHLNEEEAALYRESNWLLPKKQADNRVEPPLMSNMSATGSNKKGLTPVEAMNLVSGGKRNDPVSQSIDNTIASEKKQDAGTLKLALQKQTEKGETSGKGTGDTSVI